MVGIMIRERPRAGASARVAAPAARPRRGLAHCMPECLRMMQHAHRMPDGTVESSEYSYVVPTTLLAPQL